MRHLPRLDRHWLVDDAVALRVDGEEHEVGPRHSVHGVGPGEEHGSSHWEEVVGWTQSTALLPHGHRDHRIGNGLTKLHLFLIAKVYSVCNLVM